MTTAPGRNDPCPCGSGRKYKNCHAGKQNLAQREIAGIRAPWLIGIGAVLIAIIVGVAITSQGNRPVATGGAVPVAGSASGPVPAAWAYDSVSNRHYDPGHGHWHDGPPPAGAAQSTPTLPSSPSASVPGGAVPAPPTFPAGTTPAPWQYDAATNRHYDPGHGHWHEGPPPANAR
jgi:hypothetical protein